MSLHDADQENLGFDREPAASHGIVTQVTQQLWGSPPPPSAAPPPGPVYGRQPGEYARSAPSPAFSAPPFGAGGVPSYGPPPTVPVPRPSRGPRVLLLALMALAVLAIAGFVVAGISGEETEVGYANDDYQVPPPDTSPPELPLPETYEQAEEWTTKNALYGQAMPAPVRCNSQPINVTTASDAELKSHFEGLMECLVRVWQPPVTAAGFIIVRPTVTIYGDQISTKCGTADVNAFYCSADQQLYYSNQLPNVIESVAENKWTADVVMAHEYAHLVQGRAGIAVSAHALGQRSGDKDTEFAYIRRLETQADCFSGSFLRSVSVSLGIQQADVDGILATYVAIGDDTLSGDPNIVGNHGLGRSRQYWGQTGLRSGDVTSCNTFIAPPNLVR